MTMRATLEIERTPFSVSNTTTETYIPYNSNKVLLADKIDQGSQYHEKYSG